MNRYSIDYVTVNMVRHTAYATGQTAESARAAWAQRQLDTYGDTALAAHPASPVIVRWESSVM